MDCRTLEKTLSPIDGERDAFICLDPEGAQIRHPPPPHELDSYITPDDHVFHTMHMGVAVVDYSKYQLIIDGLVERPLTLSLEQLKQLPQTSVTAFHECYGSPLKPPVEALWRIGNVRWTGVQLSYLLSLVGVLPKNERRFIWSEGLDRGSFAGVTADRYQKDFPIAKAIQPEVLVAYEMNGEPLTKERGGPARLVVPGYFGTNSTKWLSRLSVQDERASGPYTTRFYNEIDPRDPQQKTLRPIWNVEVNSMITCPRPDESVLGPDIQVHGWAWSDHGIEKVEVSCDEGRTWIDTSLQSRFEYGWQRFDITLQRPVGNCTLSARATSLNGDQQPLSGRRNHVHQISIAVASR
ncbi:Oxidoreductase, molybdopterin-binding domain-containing protein [Pyrenochaeta sp. MPI-SDFR-AT-0127]|nr:Oxidoreductase, molybdopterin-binding domain-containing protein [Pyrenochaeta sp. MPI-SDFR-AT-0127]